MTLEQMKAVHERLGILIRQAEDRMRDERYAANVKNLGITMDDVQLSLGNDLPWFGHYSYFFDWCDKYSKKPWREWDTLVFPGRELNNPVCDLNTIRNANLQGAGR
jgi:hypothetical protein